MHELWRHIGSAYQRGESILKVYPLARVPRWAIRWLFVTIAVVAVVPLLLLSTRRSSVLAVPTGAARVRSLPFTLAAEGERLSFGWNREALAIRAGKCGVLWIADGGIRRRLVLDASQLRAGKLFYWPVYKDVSFELTMSERKTDCTPPLTSAEVPARQEQPVERIASRSRLNTAPQVERRSIESRSSEGASIDENAWIESSSAPASAVSSAPEFAAFAVYGESQEVASIPVRAIQVPAASEPQMVSTAVIRDPEVAAEPYSTVTVEAIPETKLGRIVSKIPLLRRLNRTAEMLPPRPIRETTPAIPAELRRRLKSEVPLDVRAYVDESGKVTYAEMVSDLTEEDRDLATLAVFDARRWEFMPAQLAGQPVAGQVILHYRFSNPLLASSREPR